METHRVALSLFQQHIMENTNMYTRQLEASYFLYTEKNLCLIHFKSGHFRFLLRMYFIALANFNLKGQSILITLLVSKSLMLERQATGSLVSAKDCNLVSDYQLTQKCHFLLQIVTLLCVTQMRHKSVFPTEVHGNDLVLVGGDGAIAWTMLPFFLRRKQRQHWWAAGNRMEYLPSLSAIFDIQWLWVPTELPAPQLKRCHFQKDWREVGEYWIQTHTHHSSQILYSQPEDTFPLKSNP